VHVTNTPTSIVFFDGHCALCNGTVAKLIKIDHDRLLRYAPLQGEYAREHLPLSMQSATSSVLFWSEGTLYDRSEAARRILIRVGGAYRALGHLLWVIPRFIADRVYDLVARNRYRMFGRREVCSVPSPEVRQLFLP
jgi:predicted DCC family thiol-disulfide oxidoreductase YuxK